MQDLRDARDAHVVFEAVRLGILPLITRRLTASEREQLASGNVFVWEEAEHKQGKSVTYGCNPRTITHARSPVSLSRRAGKVDRWATLVSKTAKFPPHSCSRAASSSQVAEQNARRLSLLRGEDRNDTRRERSEGGPSVSRRLLPNLVLTVDKYARARRTLDPFAAPPAPIRRQDRPSKPDGLTKQTYSTHVHTRRGESPRKWHIVAYFSVRHRGLHAA